MLRWVREQSPGVYEVKWVLPWPGPVGTFLLQNASNDGDTGLCCCCSGVPYDMQQRNTVAEVINDGLGTNVTAKDVIVVSAMEATGVSYAVDR